MQLPFYDGNVGLHFQNSTVKAKKHNNAFESDSNAPFTSSSCVKHANSFFIPSLNECIINTEGLADGWTINAFNEGHLSLF